MRTQPWNHTLSTVTGGNRLLSIRGGGQSIGYTTEHSSSNGKATGEPGHNLCQKTAGDESSLDAGYRHDVTHHSAGGRDHLQNPHRYDTG
ncbi:unnamed protein product [Boreogadus saida]